MAGRGDCLQHLGFLLAVWGGALLFVEFALPVGGVLVELRLEPLAALVDR